MRWVIVFFFCWLKLHRRGGHPGSCTGIQLRSQNLHHFYPLMGSNWGYLFSSVIKITVVRQVRIITCIYFGLSVKMNTWKRHTAHEDCGCICFAFVSACVDSKNPNTPNLSPIADDAITRGGNRGLGSPLYICGWLPFGRYIRSACTGVTQDTGLHPMLQHIM